MLPCFLLMGLKGRLISRIKEVKSIKPIWRPKDQS